MRHNQFTLLVKNRFLPLFVTQFLGAFHDNLFKNALIVLLLYGTGFTATHDYDPKLLVTLAAGVFILPYILFSAIGGQLADKYRKEKVIRLIKMVEINIAMLGTLAILSSSVTLCFIVLFVLGTQSAFFNPSKYSILPQHLQKDELIAGNALLNTGTFLAILFGTIVGTILVTLDFGKIYVCVLMNLCAFTGYLVSCFIPLAPAPDPDLKMNYNPFYEVYDILRQTIYQERHIILSILGIAWFYFLGAMFMAQFPNYTYENLGADERVLTLFMVVFSIGIGIGGLFNNWLLKGEISTKLVPWALLGISVFSTDLYFATKGMVPDTSDLTPFTAFIHEVKNWRIIIDIVLISVCGGLFMVPLSATVQHYTAPDHRARILAGNAIINAIFIILSSIIAAVLIAYGFKITELFLVFGIANVVVAFMAWKLLVTPVSP